MRLENNPQATTRNGIVTVAGQSVAFEQLGYNPGTTPLSEPTDLSVRYYHTDAIGSVRLITRENGSE